MTDIRAWPIRPKWHRLESPRSYAQRQCRAAGIPFEDVERGLTSPTQPYIYRVWKDETAAAVTVEAAAGRAADHYLRLRHIAQPNQALTYHQRFLCRLCAAGDRVEQIPHDRENWCLRHPGQMVWTGPGTTPETQLVVAYDGVQAKAERTFRRIVASGLVDTRLHTRASEIVRDSARLTTAGHDGDVPDGEVPDVRTRAEQYPRTVALMKALSDTATIERWRSEPPATLRREIACSLPAEVGVCEVLLERIVLWLRPMRRELRETRHEPLDVPMDLVDAPKIIDSAAQYPRWIQRRPQAVAEWDWSRNDPGSDPWEASRSSKRAWWVCDVGHSWQAVIATRAQAGCPYCAGQSIWPGHNDLRTRAPAVAAEWDDSPGANAGDPDHVGAQSTRRVNWKCPKGHRWAATITNRTRIGAGCPYCSGYLAIPGENDLVTLRPDLAAEWDAERNGDLSAATVGPGSSRKVWWKGPCGHRWQAVVNKRALYGQNCPYCSRRRVLPGDNDLATVRPDLAAEWDTSNELRADQVLPKSGRKATWRCASGHIWETTPHKRSNGRGCPYCAGNRVIVGETDLASISPEIAKEWSPDNALSPTDVKPFTLRKVKWLCARGHSWEATVASRSRGVRCPHCRSQNKQGVSSPL